MNYIVSSGKTSSGIILNGSDSMTVLDGGIATATTADGGGLTVSSGGTTNDTTVNGSRLEDKMSSVRGSMTVDGGVAINTLLLLGNMTVSKSGIANGVTVSAALWKNGSTWIHAERCTLRVLDGGVVNDATADWGEIFVASGGEANRIVVSGYRTDNNSVDAGHVTLLDGGVIRDAEIGDGGQLYVSGGVVNRTTVTGGGDLRIFSNGTANDVTVSAAGRRVYVSGGGKLTGRISIASNASVSAYGGAILDFDISDLAPGAEARINDLSRISGWTNAVFTLTVSGSQEHGTYALAGGAAGFSKSITVVNTSGTQLHTLSVGQAAIIGGLAYTLRLDGGILGLEIRTDIVAPTVTNVTPSTLEPAKSVTVTAVFADDGILAQSLYRIGETGEWTAYDNGVTVTGNTTVYFKAVDAAGNESEVAAYEVTNIAEPSEIISGLVLTGVSRSIGSGQVYLDTTVNSGGWMYIGSGGTADNTTVNSDGIVWISSGGTANNTVNNWAVIVSNGGAANNTTVNKWGQLDVSDGGTANTATVNSGGIMYVSGGTANCTTVSGGWMYVYSGGTANSNTVSGGWMYVYSGGTANSNTVSSGGSLIVSSGGTANCNTVSSGGRLSVSQGGTALAIRENGGYVDIREGAIVSFLPNTFSGLTLTGDATIHSGTTANAITVNSGRLYVFDGGTANSATVNSGCWMYVSSGGTADSVTVNSGGRLIVSSGGTANSTTVSGGELSVSSGGTANSTTVSGGELSVSSGGTANSTTLVPGGRLIVSSGGTASIVFNPFANVTARAGAAVTYLEREANIYFGSRMYGTVSSADTMTGLAIQSGFSAIVYQGGKLDNTTVDSDGNLIVYSGGTVNSATVNSGGKMYVVGGTANNMTVNSGGGLIISSGGTANSATVNSGSFLHVSGGKLTGKTTIEDGATIDLPGGTILDFDISDLAPGAAARINDLSRIYMMPDTVFTLTVAETPSTGTYSLANGASGFNSSISVQNTSGVQLRTLSVGRAAIIGGLAYTLRLDGGILDLEIRTDTMAPTVTNIMPSPLEPTNGSVTVTAAFADDVELAQSLYRVGETGEWSAYDENGVTVSGNTTVYFKAVDAAGNESEVASCEVSNIDKVKPTVSGVTPSTLEPAKYVTVTAVFADDMELAQSLYRVGETGEWSAYDENGVTVSGNTTVYFKAVDAAGNESEVSSCEISNIEKSAEIISGLVVRSNESRTVESGQLYLDTEIREDAVLFISSDGMAVNTSIEYYGSMTVFSGGTANNTTVNNYGNLTVSGGGVATNIAAASGAYLELTVAPETSIQGTSAGVAFEVKDASISGYTVGNGWLIVSGGGTADSVTVNSGGWMSIGSGGTADNTTIKAYGSLTVSSGGTANSTTVSGGRLIVTSGGTASIVFNPFANVTSSAGAVVTYLEREANVYYGSGMYGTVSSAGTMTELAIQSGFSAIVYRDGKMDNTTVNAYGSLTVSSGGTADNATVNAYGSLTVSSGGTANGIVENGGYVYVEDGATVGFSSNTFSGLGLYRASATVHSGTTASQTRVSAGGSLTVLSGGTADNTSVGYSGNMTVFSGGTANETNVSGGSLTVLSGGTANETNVSGGSLTVFSGGTANSTTVSGGRLTVFSGGTANNTTVNNYGNLTVSGGGVATNIAAASGAYLELTVASETYIQGTSGGVAFEMKDASISGYTVGNGWLIVSSGGTTDNIKVSGGSLTVLSGGTANSTTLVPGGIFYISSGGTANNTTVSSGCRFIVSSGVTANGITIYGNASLTVSSGVASDIRVYAGGTVTLTSGATITGRMNFAAGAVIFTKEGSVVDFDLTQVSPGGKAILTDWSLLQGRPDYTLTIDGSEEHGVYALADGAADFDETITVVNASGTELGTLSVGTSATISDVDYALSLSDGILSLQVTSGGVSSGGTPSEIISGLVLEDETLSVESGQAYLDTEIREGAALVVSGGGTAENTMVCTDANLTVLSGGTATGTTVAEDGHLSVSGGGTADHVVVSGGSLTVSSGGTATDIVWTPCEGTVIIETGAVATFADEHSGVYLGTYGQLVSHAAVMTGKQIYGSDEMCVMSGGTAVDTTACDGSMFVFSGGVANDTVLADGEDYARGRMYVFGGGTADGTVVSGGYLGVSGGTAAGAVVLRGLVEVKDGGTANDTVVSRTLEEWDSYDGEGGSRTEYGSMYVSGGVANGVSVSDGVLIVGSGGTAADVFMNNESSYGGRIESSFSDEFGPSYRYNPGVHVSAGGRLTGRITLNDRAKVYADNGAVLDFDLTRTPAGAAALLNDLSGIEGAPYYTLTVDGREEHGVYALADGVSAFYSVITVVNTSGAQLGSLAPGNTITVGPSDYTLNLADGSLTVTVMASEAIPPDEDTAAPSAPSALMSYVIGRDVILTWNASMDDTGVKEYVVTYSLDGQVFTARTNNSHYLLDNADLGSYGWSIRAVDFAGNESGIAAGDAFTVSGFKPYTVEYSPDDFRHAIRFSVTTPELDLFRMPNDTYRLRIRQEGDNEWLAGDPIVAAEFDGTPQLVMSDADGNMDVFFANGVDTWESGYLAQHVGSVNDWAGTNEYAAVFGKNKLTDIIEGSADANILLMTDDPNGDTLFVEDIYSDSPDGLGLSRSRIARIDEIRAGAGDDVVDMTSRQFEYIGSGLTIRGGEGNDVIWANKGGNRLFGDAGNDRIVGASGNDVIAGGIGNDRMHGGGGDDVFTFCDNWGADNVEQLETGSVTLWFASGDNAKWDAGTLTYTDGENSVRVSGVAADRITLKFGDDGSDRFAALASAGAFFDATTERIFEETGKGILAGI